MSRELRVPYQQSPSLSAHWTSCYVESIAQILLTGRSVLLLSDHTLYVLSMCAPLHVLQHTSPLFQMFSCAHNPSFHRVLIGLLPPDHRPLPPVSHLFLPSCWEFCPTVSPLLPFLYWHLKSPFVYYPFLCKELWAMHGIPTLLGYHFFWKYQKSLALLFSVLTAFLHDLWREIFLLP